MNHLIHFISTYLSVCLSCARRSLIGYTTDTDPIVQHKNLVRLIQFTSQQFKIPAYTTNKNKFQNSKTKSRHHNGNVRITVSSKFNKNKSIGAKMTVKVS